LSAEASWASSVATSKGQEESLAYGQTWVLQMGYFANLDNAQGMQQLLTEAGYEAVIYSTGLPGNQRYKVVTGEATDQGEIEQFADDVARRTGLRGIVKPNPIDDNRVSVVAADDPFEPLKPSMMLAQAETRNSGATPMRDNAYDPMTNRTPYGEIDDMAGFNVGGVVIIPTIGASIGYDDNITRANTNEIGSSFYMISPAVRAELPTDHSVVGLTAAANWIWYSDSSQDDRDSWILSADWMWDISARQDLGLFANYTEDVDQRGTGRTQGDAGLIEQEPDAWKQFGYGGQWDYGAVGSRGRVSLLAGASDITYQNNRGDGTETVPGTTALDRDWWYWGGTFYWRVAPKTSLLANYQYTDMSYETASSSDSTIENYMLGVTWDATARTDGTIQYGVQKRNFEDPSQPDYDGPTWLASVNWRPRTYSLFTLSASRATQEPDGGGAYMLRQDVMLSWIHQWAERFGTNVDIGYGEDEYKPSSRTDDLIYWGVGANYTFNQHFRFGASITGYDRDSDINEYNYQRLVYLLTLEASF